jgi:hypothetical protein
MTASRLNEPIDKSRTHREITQALIESVIGNSLPGKMEASIRSKIPYCLLPCLGNGEIADMPAKRLLASMETRSVSLTGECQHLVPVL